jgi:hypothetical protein
MDPPTSSSLAEGKNASAPFSSARRARDLPTLAALRWKDPGAGPSGIREHLGAGDRAGK